MKPLLRAVLIIDAVLLLAFGVLFVLTPWQSLFNALQLANIQPAMLGQAFGIALLGLAWLAFHAAFNGDLTAPVARSVGHVYWLTGALTIVWSLATGSGPALAAAGRVLSAVAGVALIVLGLGGVRLASAVRRREKAQALEARAPAQRPAEPAMAPASSPAPQRVEPVVSRPAAPAAPSSAASSQSSSGGVALDERPPMQD
ncbi:alkaline shock response membrane anchor protein AmaP [Burkholderia pyrrocinia]|uniref:alkaline shock response membrane anchor protein AmaP n=1 Tax=Burkholderia pyrrocinia TaxID=60550 RepID=UPI00215B311A|nr:alkaline shock response membrane anchor protein AmaP [Burkholderia pyrrocinia]UVE65145.1 alkaline shock response membrane anchor protein AmaP [Burkholderia pyrrocinia]